MWNIVEEVKLMGNAFLPFRSISFNIVLRLHRITITEVAKRVRPPVIVKPFSTM